MSEFQEKISELVGKMEQSDDGKWTLPEDVAEELDEPTLFAVTSERRYRDTQAGYTKAKQESKRHEAAANALEEHILSNTEAPLTPEQKTELDTLKTTNPEAWREKLNEYETAGKSSVADNLKEIRKNSADKGEVEIRKDQMDAFVESTGIALTDELIAEELPPRFLKALEKGETTFEEFLTGAAEFLTANKIIQGSNESTDDDTKNLSRVAGGKEPTEDAQYQDDTEQYEKTMF